MQLIPCNLYHLEHISVSHIAKTEPLLNSRFQFWVFKSPLLILSELETIILQSIIPEIIPAISTAAIVARCKGI
jgi:hypothetical protein